MSLEQEARSFAQQLQVLYLKCIFKTGHFADAYRETEISENLSAALELLQTKIGEYSGGYTVLEPKLEFIPLSESFCAIYGIFHKVSEEEPFHLEFQNVRISAVLEKQADGMRLVHLHLLKPDADQEYGESSARGDLWGDPIASRGIMNQNSEALRDRNLQFVSLAENIPGGVFRCRKDRDFTLLDMNKGFFEMFGYTDREIRETFRNSLINMIYREDRENVRKYLAEERGEDCDTLECEYRIVCKDGSVAWVLDKSKPMIDEDGMHYYYCVLIDITRQKRERELLRLSLESYQIVMDQSTDIMFVWDIGRDTLEFSINWEKKFGYEPIRTNVSAKIPETGNINSEDMPALLMLMKSMEAGVSYSETELRIRNIQKQDIWCRIRASMRLDSQGHPMHAVGIIVDIDEEKMQKELLMKQAQRDLLTGLYNKHTIQMLVEKQMRPQAGETYQAMFILDIDNFKSVNDTYGHLCGDALLCEVANNLKKQVRSTDLVGRVGGDEFLIFMPMVCDKEAVAAKTTALISSLNKIKPEKNAPPITCSAGVALFAQGATDFYAFFKCADRALYYVKKNGRNGFAFYDPSLCADCVPCGLAPSAINEMIDSQGINYVNEELARYIFLMLYDSVDINTAVNRILEIVGRAYDVSRVYIFENSEDGNLCSNTFEWCGDGVPSEIDHLQNISYQDDFVNYQDNFDENGIFYCRDIKDLHTDLYDFLEEQGIVSLLQCAILDFGIFKGYVGFDECRENRLWTKQQIDSLTLTANILSTFLLKERMKEQFEKKHT